MSLKNTSFFNPTSITGCTLWLDGADPAGNGVVPAVGSTLSSWIDKSITQNNFTGTNVTYTFDSTYGAKSPTFNGNSEMAQTNTSLYSINNVTTLSFFCVSRNTGGGLATIYNGNTSTQTNYILYRYSSSSVQWYGGDTVSVYPVSTDGNGNGITSFIVNPSGTGTGYVNGTSFGSGGTSGSSGQAIFILGHQYTGGAYLTGYIYEFIIYNTALSTVQRQSIEGYLAWKWRLTSSLPSSHPYALSPSFGLPSIVPNALAKTSLTYANHPVVAISGCALWLDASDSSTISYSSGSNLSQWRDKSGNGYIMANNTGTTTVASAELNSYNAIYTPSGTSAKIASFTGRTKFTLFFVGKCAVGRYLLGFNNGCLYAGNDTLLNITAPGNTFDCVDSIGLGTSVVSANTWFIFSIGYDNVTAFTPNPYNINGSPLNGANRTTITSPYVTPSIVPDQYLSNPFYINSLGTNSYDSDYTAEIIFYNTNLNVSQRQNIEGYLAQKWGLTANLPAGHPYKSSFPVYLLPTTGVRRVASRRWSPLTPGNCQLWLDAADSSTFTFTTGNFISVWRDKSTFNNGGTVNTTPKPLLRITSPSKQPSLFFDGTCGIPLGSSFTSSLCSNFIIVFAPTPAAQLTNAQYAGNGYGGQMLLINGGAGGGEIQIQPDGMHSLIGSWKHSYFASRIESYSIAQFEFNYGTSLMNLWQNGILAASTAFSNGTATAPSQLGISEYFGTFGVAPYIGDIAEIIYYSVSLSNPQREQVEGYLAWKWGLKASLPSSHPYKLFPPSP